MQSTSCDYENYMVLDYDELMCSMGVRYYSPIPAFVDGGRVRDYYAGD